MEAALQSELEASRTQDRAICQMYNVFLAIKAVISLLRVLIKAVDRRKVVAVVVVEVGRGEERKAVDS